MKTFIYMAVLGIIIMMLDQPSINAQTASEMEYDNKVIIPGDYGVDMICLNNWVAPQIGNSIGNTVPGVCKGKEISNLSLAAISAKNSDDKLEQIRLLLEKISSNLEMAVAENKKSIAVQNRLADDYLREIIVDKFDGLPPETLANKQVKEALNRLKQDILEAFKKRGVANQ